MVPPDDPHTIAAGWDDLARARTGSIEAWRSLFAQYSPALLRMTAVLTGSPDAARDCVQETFIRLLSSSAQNQGTPLRTYLSTIAYRFALKEQQRTRRQAGNAPVEAVSPEPSPLDAIIADDRQREVARILAALPGHHREVLALRFYGEHSYEEIACITGAPIGTVKSRLFNAVKSARQLMKRGGIL